MIPYGKQDITDEDIAAVVQALKSDFLTQGPLIEKFEKEIADYCNVKYAVAVSSCTAALHLAYAGLGLTAGKRLWTVPNTFVATANSALYCGADIDFIDIDRDTYLIYTNHLEEKLIYAAQNNILPDIVVPVHFSGQSCEIERLKQLSIKYGFKIVEDAAHCIGASYKGQKIGSCAFSDASVFSFHPVKIITTAEGGMITTNSEELYKKCLMLRTHGITKSPSEMHNAKEDEPWYFEQQHLGYHYRITDLQCALGSSQLNRLDSYVERRTHLVERYLEKLSHLPLKLPKIVEGNKSSWHLFVVQIDPEHVSKSRAEVFGALREKDIGVNVHYIPVHMHPHYKELGFREGQFPNAEEYYKHTITLPLYPGLTHDEQDYVCDALEEIIGIR